MCGIAGLLSQRNSADELHLLQKATRLLQHRGPESEAFWSNETGAVHFGHRRLCIIDLSTAAAQPMHYADRYTIIYNGEIYNYLEIKKDLQAKGYPFHSSSDTEVILAAFAEWGPGCLERFDGAFAFAIWDEKDQSLFAARDRFGEKPFFFFYDEERLAFASEIKALWPLGIAKEVNQSMLYNFLAIGYTANPSDATETFYQNIQKLPSAHYLTYSLPSNSLQLHHYWQVYTETDTSITEDEATNRFNELFKDSISKRLRSDVAIGTSLSGGLDSSTIVAFCADEKAFHYSHKCFTASFSGFEKDETAFASMVADRFELEHHLTTVTEAEVSQLMEKVAAAQDEPFSSASVLAQYKVFELARQHGVTVLLDGQGADETLGGYHKYYKWYWQELYRRKKLAASGELKSAHALGVKEKFGIKNKLAALFPEFASAILQTQKAKKAAKLPGWNAEFVFSNKRNLYYTTPTSHDLNGVLHYNSFTNGLEELLRFADRNSMAHSLEVRLPFLQHQLVEFLSTLPANYKIHDGWTKWLLRKTVEKKLPAEIVWRRDKIGYEPPQKTWMQNSLVQERIREGKKKLVTKGILDRSVLDQKIVPKAAHDDESYDWRFWSAACLY